VAGRATIGIMGIVAAVGVALSVSEVAYVARAVVRQAAAEAQVAARLQSVAGLQFVKATEPAGAIAPFEPLATAAPAVQLGEIVLYGQDYYVQPSAEGVAVVVVSGARMRAALLRPALFALAVTLLGAAAVLFVMLRANGVGAAPDSRPSAALNAPAPELANITSQLESLSRRLAGQRTELELTRGRLRQVVGNLEERVMMVNQEGVVVTASPQLAKLLGLGGEEMVGRPIADALGDDHALVGIVNEVLSRRCSIEQRSVLVGDADSRRIAASAQYVVDGDTPVGVLLSVKDLDSVRRLEAHVDYASKLAQLSRITSGVSHEIKNPLNAMVIHLEILRAKLESGEGDPTPQLDVLEGEIKRLDRVVRTFLDFTRPVDVRLEVRDLNSMLDQVTRLASADAEAAGVRLVRKSPAGELLIRADADLFTQALLNLVQNGIQAMPRGGTLVVRVERIEGGQLRIDIQDEGVGIPEESREKIFRLYYTTKERGTGIGLAQVFRAVQLHDGKIDFVSRTGEGTTFTIVIQGHAS
jgi:PAS domain S-box-containing protein